MIQPKKLKYIFFLRFISKKIGQKVRFHVINVMIGVTE